MKPRYRPGKVAAHRPSPLLGKTLSIEQMGHLRNESASGSLAKKAGRGGKRAKWKPSYEEGAEYQRKGMPYRENETFSQEGIRKLPKRGR